MQRIEINVQTGERKLLELTPAEVADAEARTAAESAKPPLPTEGMRIVQKIIADAAALRELMAAASKMPA